MNELMMNLLKEQLLIQRKMRKSRCDRSELSQDQVTHLCVEALLCCLLMESMETME
jgi:hypothetical protein